jgi:hypothetical protein
MDYKNNKKFNKKGFTKWQIINQLLKELDKR